MKAVCVGVKFHASSINLMQFRQQLMKYTKWFSILLTGTVANYSQKLTLFNFVELLLLARAITSILSGNHDYIFI